MSAAPEIRMGRPPKPGPREPSGRLSRSRSAHAEWQSMTAHAQRIRDAVLHDARARAEFEWSLGKLFLWGRLAAPSEADAKAANARRYAAGKLFLEVVQRSNAAMGLPPQTPQGQDLSSVRGGGRESDPAQDLKAQARYYAAEAAMGGHRSREAQTVNEVVVLGSAPVGHEALLLLRDGLQRLADHFRVAR